jgi:hypothetical protein
MEFIPRIKNTAMIIIRDNQKITNETEYAINNQTENLTENLTMYNIYICRDCLFNEYQGELNGNLQASQGGLTELIHPDQMVLKIVREGG